MLNATIEHVLSLGSNATGTEGITDLNSGERAREAVKPK